MLSKGTVLKYYKRRDIQEALVAHAQQKEVGMCYGEGYGQRPDVLSYPNDVIELAIRGVTSFHASEERWENPLGLSSVMSKKEQDELRKAWDLVLDIDCKILDYSKICAELIIRFLRYCGVQSIGCKFSGNKGFHVGVPFEAFPKQVGEKWIKDLFPEAPRKIAWYVKENIKGELGRRILEFEQGSFSSVKEKVNIPQEELIRYEKDAFNDKVAKLNVDPFLEIDTVLLASRHLYRMPYSLHEKSGLVSLPISPDEVISFEKKQADPLLVTPQFSFLERNDSCQSARQLLSKAFDFQVKIEEEREPVKKFDELNITSPITENFFPPCMKRILQGLEDGKKRGMFCLMGFLGKVGWSKPDIEKFLMEWNKKNPEPLREVYIKGQLSHFNPGERLPPNCNNDAYYKGIGIKCNPEEHCQRLKNPVNYTLSRWRRHLWDMEKAQEKIQEKNESI